MAPDRTLRHARTVGRCVRTVLSIALLTIIAATLTACGGSDDVTISTEPITSTAEQEDSAGQEDAGEEEAFEIPDGALTITVGEQLQAGPYTIAVASTGGLDIDSVGIPDEGYRWLGVDVLVTNTTNEDLSVDTYPYPIENVRVDAGGEAVSGWLITGLGQDVSSSGFFTPGTETQITYGYEIPIGEEDLTLLMEPVTSGAPTVVVPITE